MRRRRRHRQPDGRALRRLQDDLRHRRGGEHKTLLTQLSGWNGRANDKKVTVGVFGSDGINEMPPERAGCTTQLTPDSDGGRPAGGYYTPTWCGDHVWSVLEKSVLSTTSTPPLVPVRTGSGYVKDHQLVVVISNDAVQVPARDLFVVASTFTVPGSGGTRHLCSDPLFDQVKTVICPQLDIAREPSRDLDPSFLCDALSSTIGFEGAPARSGAFYTAPESNNECRLGAGDKPVDAGREVVYGCPEAGP